MSEDDMADDMTAEEQEYYESQMALPPHKRDGYAERMYEFADFERKRAREEQ